MDLTINVIDCTETHDLPVFTAPPAVIGKEIAYMLKMDDWVEEIPMYKTANGWWLSKSRVEAFFTLIKKGHYPTQAAANIGISRSSYYYWLNAHEGLLDIIEAYKEMSITPFTDALYSDGAKDLTTVRWTLGKLDERFKPIPKVEPEDKVLQPSEGAAVNAKIEQVNININAKELSGILADFSRAVLGTDSTISRTIAEETVAESSPAGSQ